MERWDYMPGLHRLIFCLSTDRLPVLACKDLGNVLYPMYVLFSTSKNWSDVQWMRNGNWIHNWTKENIHSYLYSIIMLLSAVSCVAILAWKHSACCDMSLWHWKRNLSCYAHSVLNVASFLLCTFCFKCGQLSVMHILFWIWLILTGNSAIWVFLLGNEVLKVTLLWSLN